MNSKFFGKFLGSLILMVLLVGNVWAQVPLSINYQGKLANSAGIPLNADPADPQSEQIDIMFSIYDAEESKVWPTTIDSEAFLDVPVKDGLFSLLIGSKSTDSLSAAFNGQPRYLNVHVRRFDSGGNLVADKPLLPRKEIVAVAYAIKADKADKVINGAISSSSITLATTTSTEAGNIAYDATNNRIVVGNGNATDSFYPGAHTSDTSAAIVCSGTSTYLDGDGNCDAGAGDVNCSNCVTLGAETIGNYAGSDSVGGAANSANDLTCTDCVDATKIADGLGVTEIDESVIQQRVFESCAEGSSIRAINQDGTVDCEIDDTQASGEVDPFWFGNVGLLLKDGAVTNPSCSVDMGIQAIFDGFGEVKKENGVIYSKVKFIRGSYTHCDSGWVTGRFAECSCLYGTVRIQVEYTGGLLTLVGDDGTTVLCGSREPWQ